MKKLLFLIIGLATLFAGCKKNNDNINAAPGTVSAYINNKQWASFSVIDTVIIQVDTEVLSTNQLVLGPPSKKMTITAKGTDSTILMLSVIDNTLPQQGNSIKSMEYPDPYHCYDYYLFYGSKEYSCSNIFYQVNAASSSYYSYVSGNVTITSFNEQNQTVSGTFECVLRDGYNSSPYYNYGSTDTIHAKGAFKDLPYVLNIKALHNSVKATVNGIPWAGNATSCSSSYSTGYNNNPPVKAFMLSAGDAFGSVIELRIEDYTQPTQSKSIRLGTYLDQYRSTDTIIRNSGVYYTSSSATYYGGSSQYGYSYQSAISITACDTNAMTVSGTFSYLTSNGTTDSISNGTFNDIPYTSQ